MQVTQSRVLNHKGTKDTKWKSERPRIRMLSGDKIKRFASISSLITYHPFSLVFVPSWLIFFRRRFGGVFGIRWWLGRIIEYFLRLDLHHHVLHVGGPFFWLLGHRSLHVGRELGSDIFVEHGEGLRLRAQVPLQQLIGGIGSKRWLAREKLMQHAAEAVYVRAKVLGLAANLFRRHVTVGASDPHLATEELAEPPCRLARG